METISYIKRLISEGELESALKMLESIDTTYKSTVLSLSTRYSLFKDKVVKGIISEADKNLEQNTIVHNLINIIHKIENEQVIIASFKNNKRLSKVFSEFKNSSLNENDNKSINDDIKARLSGEKSIDVIINSTEVDVVYDGINNEDDVKILTDLLDFLNLARAKMPFQNDLTINQGDDSIKDIEIDERKSRLVNMLSSIILKFSNNNIEIQFFELTEPVIKRVKDFIYQLPLRKMVWLPLLLSPYSLLISPFLLLLLPKKQALLIKIRKLK